MFVGAVTAPQGLPVVVNLYHLPRIVGGELFIASCDGIPALVLCKVVVDKFKKLLPLTRNWLLAGVGVMVEPNEPLKLWGYKINCVLIIQIVFF